MRNILFFILLVSFVSVKICTAQIPTNFMVRQYSTENGLPSNGIKGLWWDAQTNFLWIGTEAGIIRFNGIDFTTNDKKSIAGATLERVSAIYSNKLGNLIAYDQIDSAYNIVENKPIRIQNNGLFKIEQQALPVVFRDDILSKMENDVKAISTRLPFKTIATNSESCFLLNYKYELFFYSANKFGTVKNSIGFKNIFTITNVGFVLLNNNSIGKIKENGNIDFKNYDITRANNSKLLLSPKALVIWETGMKNPILFDNENAWLLTYEKEKIRATNICNAIPKNTFIRFAQYDSVGKTLFIGTDSKGIIIIKAQSILSVNNVSVNNERNSYYSQIKVDENNILTNEGHVIGTNKNISNNLANLKRKISFRTSLTSDSTLWYLQKNNVESFKLLCSYNFKTNQNKIYKNTLITNAASVAIQKNIIYVTTVNGVAILNNDSLHYLYKYKIPLLGSNEPFDLMPFGNDLIFATCKNLLKYNIAKNSIDTIFTAKQYCIRTIKLINDYIFIGTYGEGFYVYKNGRAKSIALDKNKFLLFTHCFIIDDYGYCWLSSNRGLYKALLSDILTAYEKNIPEIYYHYFGKNDGMNISELNGGCSPCALALNVNTISFPSMDGLLWVNPKRKNIQLPNGNIYVDNFIVNDSIVYNIDDKDIQLPVNTKTISIQLGYSAWCNKENIYISYRLNNSEDWKLLDSKAESEIKFTNLNDGTYNLEIRKLNGFGINNYAYKTIQFTIITAWYKRWWFYVLATNALIGLLFIFYKLRTKNLLNQQLKLENLVTNKTIELQEKNDLLEKNNEINTRLISIISHDIITPLKFLNVAGKNLLEKKALMSEELKDETINEITTTSKELQLLSTNILNWIKYQNENRRLIKEPFYVHEMLNQIFGVLNSLANSKRLKLINDIPKQLVITEFNEPLKILVYNLLTNAIHFSHNGNITVRHRKVEEKNCIEVLDNGVGMSEDQIKNIMADKFIISSANINNKKGNGLGYLIIKDLIKMMSATLEISSAKQEGTKVSIYLESSNN
jgi:signal transduction histidine kinase